MKAIFPEDYGKFNEYDFDNRISYDEESDTMYIYVAPPQGQVGAVLVYQDKNTMVSIDTDEVNTQVGIEIIGVSELMEKFNLKKRLSNN
jgi:uncharacterized protein YuzE